MKLAAGALAGALLAWLIAPQLFTEFASVRLKVVRTAVPAGAEQFRVPIRAEAALETLRAPFAAISRVRNDGTVPLVVRVAVDDRELCSAEIPPGASRRLDCVVRGPWTGRDSHSVLFSAASPRYTVEYFELATHHGALSPGPKGVIVVPAGFSAFTASSAWHVLAIFGLVALSVMSVRHARLPKAVSVIHLAVTTVVGGLMAIVVLSGFVSEYSLLISDAFLERLLVLTALPALVIGTYALLTWIRRNRPGALPVARSVGVGLIVGGIFLSFANRHMTDHYKGNPSGLLLVSHEFFDKSPMRDRAEITDALHFSDGYGYDGQFFYFMAFDPFLTVFRHEPARYQTFIDFPPYRYGRIGFSLLTKVFSGDAPTRYPVTMVALVIGALALCGALLGVIAQRQGFGAWYGLLIVIVPGFWQSAQTVLPEPLAVGFFLTAYLCVARQNWWAAGALLGMSMLVRETGGVLVLALIAGIVLSRNWRGAAIVALLAFLPVVVWKGFLGWVFWADYGMTGVMPHPDDVGVPFAGVAHLWTTIARGEYFNGAWDMARAGLTYSVLTTAGATLAVIAVVKRPSPIAAAALVYAVLTLTFNYEGVWLDVGNAQRLTIDLFVALALVSLHTRRDRRLLPRTFTLFWCATACYLLFWTFHAPQVRQVFTGF